MQGKISVVIPALNEEGCLAHCLSSVFQQERSLLEEVIVADGGSTDNTVAIAKRFKITLVPGGLPGIARNNGAEIAKGEYLLFLDADTFLPPQFLQKALEVFEKKRLDVASFYLKPAAEGIISRFVLNVYNICSSISAIVLPIFLTAGCCLLVKRETHRFVGGFSNSVVVLEEYDYINRIRKSGRFRVIPLKIKTSIRRFRKGKVLRQTFILFTYYFQWLITHKVADDRYGYWTQ